MKSARARRARQVIEWLRPTRSVRTVAARRTIWKCGASLSLALVDDGSPWNADAAAASIFSLCELSGPWGDGARACKGFLVYDAAHPGFQRLVQNSVRDGV